MRHLLCLPILLLLLAAPTAVQAAPAERPLPQAVAASPLQRALAKGRLDDARVLLLDAPDTAATDLDRGLLAQLEGRLDDARRSYRRAALGMPGEAAFRLGNLDLGTGRPKEAVAAYERALRHLPAHAFARYNLALALEELGRPDQALEQVERALALDPPGAWTLVPALTKGKARTLEITHVNLFRCRALLLRGRLLAALGREGAEACWQAAPDLAPGELPEGYRNLGMEALGKGDLSAGVLWLQACLEAAVYPTGIPADLAVWGPGYFRVALPGGRTRYARSLRVGVDRDGALHRLGGGTLGIHLPPGSHGMQVDRDGVVRVWQEAAALPRAVGRLELLRLDPSALEPEGEGEGEGLYALKTGSRPLPCPAGPKEESEVLVGFRHRDPGDARVWETLAERSPEGARLVRDVPFLDTGSAISRLAGLVDGPLGPLARARLGVLYFNLFSQTGRPEDLQEARRQWEALREARPDLDFPLLNLAALAVVDHRFDDAAGLLDRLQQARPERPLPRRLLVSLALARGLEDEALQIAVPFGEAFPHDPFPPFAQAEILGLQNEKAEALEVLDRLLEINPTLVEARYLRARLLGRSGRLDDQLEELQGLLVLDATPYRARRMLGDLLERLGQREQALELYRLYLATPEALVYETEEWVTVDLRVRTLTGES